MLTIQKSKSHKGKCTPNVLPCRIHHNGPVNVSKRYWNPRTTSDGKIVAYFRGRKLHGKQLKVPKGYRGLILTSTDRILPPEQSSDPNEDGDDDGASEDADKITDVKIVEEISDFDNIMVWGHEALPDNTADAYTRGMEEWIEFAGRIHLQSEEDNKVGDEIKNA